MIELKHLCKKYNDVIPLRDVNAVINDGEIVSVIGPSGTGTSTLIRCINMLDTPTSGEILINGVRITDKNCDISAVRKKMGMVFQSFNLFGHLTAIENVMRPPMDLLGMSKQDAYDNAIRLLRTVGLEACALKYPDMLSGGQKQRVAIARTLSMDPDIILFDEPTSALDPTMVGEVQAVIRELSKTGKTMMIVTHEMNFAREICTRVFYMDDGGIYDDGTPEEIFDDPQKELTRRFIKRLKVFETVIDSSKYDFRQTVSDIDRYGYQNQIPPKTVYRIQIVFEELTQQILLPRMSYPDIFFTAEYDEAGDKVEITALYGGERFDPRTSGNDLSLNMIEKLSQSLEYSEISDGHYTNKITAVI